MRQIEEVEQSLVDYRGLPLLQSGRYILDGELRIRPVDQNTIKKLVACLEVLVTYILYLGLYICVCNGLPLIVILFLPEAYVRLLSSNVFKVSPSACLSACLPACLSFCVRACMTGWVGGWGK